MHPLAVVLLQGLSASDQFLGALVRGLALGSLYALLALGFVIIFKATQVVNFAHGAVMAAGTFLVAYWAAIVGIGGRIFGAGSPPVLQWLTALVFATATAGVIGLALERLFIRPMVGEPLFSMAMITIGMDIALRTVVDDYIGPGEQGLADPFGLNSVNLGGAIILHTQIYTLIVSILALLAVLWFFRTRLGVAMRATAFDQEAAMAQGIKVGRVFAVAWLIGAFLATIAGAFASLAPWAPLTNTKAFFALRAFPAVILGGLDSIPGAVVGGFAIGLAEVMAGTYLIGSAPNWLPWASWTWLGQGFSGVVPYVVMLIVLLVRPYGLFGTEEIRRV